MIFFPLSWYVLPAAIVLDLIVGDPPDRPHPIRWMGNAITYLEPRFRKLPGSLRISGTLFALFLILTAGGFSLFITQAAAFVHPVLGSAVQIILIYYCISIHSLKKAAMDVLDALERQGLEAARRQLAWIVGREVDNLTEDGVIRADVETVAENLVDGVISPLFFALIGGAPLAMMFKMINTLDSMVGYKNDRYLEFGRTAARIDDLANFLPARLSVPVISLAAHLMTGRGETALKTAVMEGRSHSSPNAGFSEAAFAGTLDIKLGGPNIYHGKRVNKPYIGLNFGIACQNHIRMACRLMMLSSLLWGTMISIFNALIR